MLIGPFQPKSTATSANIRCATMKFKRKMGIFRIPLTFTVYRKLRFCPHMFPRITALNSQSAAFYCVFRLASVFALYLLRSHAEGETVVFVNWETFCPFHEMDISTFCAQITNWIAALKNAVEFNGRFYGCPPYLESIESSKNLSKMCLQISLGMDLLRVDETF